MLILITFPFFVINYIIIHFFFNTVQDPIFQLHSKAYISIAFIYGYFNDIKNYIFQSNSKSKIFNEIEI